MSGRSGVRLAVGILAAFAAGCGSTRTFQPVPASPSAARPDSAGYVARAADKNPPGPIDNRYGPAATSSWPPAGREDRWGASRLPVTPAPTWPDPNHTRASYGEELADGQPTGQPAGIPLKPAGEPIPLQRPNVQPPEYYGGGYGPTPAGATVPGPGGPRGTGPAGNSRQMPTATGEWFGIGPHETPIDRAVELARKIDQVNRENLALLARIRVLEKAAADRETALGEYLRDVQSASDELTRTRVELQAVRKDLAAMKARVLQVEQDEAETLKAIIAAIEKLLQQPMPMPPDSSKK